jgi:predicted nuclease of restriction endonuclease-like (RecB) superfamily
VTIARRTSVQAPGRSALYWELGRDILERQAREGWGVGVIDQVSADLRAAFPEIKGFSRSNLKYMRAFAEAWPDLEIGQPSVGQLPRAHHLVLLTKIKTREARLAHAEQALARGWSRNVWKAELPPERRGVGRGASVRRRLGSQDPPVRLHFPPRPVSVSVFFSFKRTSSSSRWATFRCSRIRPTCLPWPLRSSCRGARRSIAVRVGFRA